MSTRPTTLFTFSVAETWMRLPRLVSWVATSVVVPGGGGALAATTSRAIDATTASFWLIRSRSAAVRAAASTAFCSSILRLVRLPNSTAAATPITITGSVSAARRDRLPDLSSRNRGAATRCMQHRRKPRLMNRA